MSDGDRFTAMEERLAHQQGEIDSLSQLVREQWQEIETLKKALLRFRDRLTEMEEAGSGPHENTPPPHY